MCFSRVLPLDVLISIQTRTGRFMWKLYDNRRFLGKEMFGRVFITFSGHCFYKDLYVLPELLVNACTSYRVALMNLSSVKHCVMFVIRLQTLYFTFYILTVVHSFITCMLVLKYIFNFEYKKTKKNLLGIMHHQDAFTLLLLNDDL